jgi:hypothetical protein
VSRDVKFDEGVRTSSSHDFASMIERRDEVVVLEANSKAIAESNSRVD